MKSEIQQRDRRAVHPTHLLYVYKKLQLYLIKQTIQIALRMTDNNAKVTAANLRDPTYVAAMQRKDDGYQFLRNIVGSPPYWETQKQNVLAMTRQLG